MKVWVLKEKRAGKKVRGESGREMEEGESSRYTKRREGRKDEKENLNISKIV